MRRFAILIVMIISFITAGAQFLEKHNQVYQEGRYDVFVIRIDSVVSTGFNFISNKAGQSETAFFDSLTQALRVPFFAITASIVDSVCNPLGLYVENGNRINPINTATGSGNFFSMPNGFISIEQDGKIAVSNSVNFKNTSSYTYALQSGPMLVSNGVINTAFDKNSKNKNIRCGVGIFSDNNGSFLVFAKSIEPVSFYQFAQLYLEEYKCTNALVLESGTNCSLHLPTYKSSYSQNISVCRYILIRL